MILVDAAALGRYEPEGTLTAVGGLGQKKRSMSRLSDSSDPHRASVLLLKGFDLVAVVAGDDADARALGERRHDLAGET
jgi:hypothetical protein